jgi:flagellar hook-basal body complex protein FliE
MTDPISYIRPISLPETAQPTKQPTAADGFKSVLESVVGQVEQSQQAAQKSAENFLSGGNEELHSVVLASQRASLEFDMFLQVRNKVVAAYQEVMRMQL